MHIIIARIVTKLYWQYKFRAIWKSNDGVFFCTVKRLKHGYSSGESRYNGTFARMPSKNQDTNAQHSEHLMALSILGACSVLSLRLTLKVRAMRL